MSPITAKLTIHCIPSTYKSHARLLFAPIHHLVLRVLVTRRFFVSVSIAGHRRPAGPCRRSSVGAPYTPIRAQGMDSGTRHSVKRAVVQPAPCERGMCMSTQNRGGKMHLDFAFVTQSLDQGSRLIEDASYLRVTTRLAPRACSLNKPPSQLKRTAPKHRERGPLGASQGNALRYVSPELRRSDSTSCASRESPN